METTRGIYVCAHVYGSHSICQPSQGKESCTLFSQSFSFSSHVYGGCFMQGVWQKSLFIRTDICGCLSPSGSTVRSVEIATVPWACYQKGFWALSISVVCLAPSEAWITWLSPPTLPHPCDSMLLLNKSIWENSVPSAVRLLTGGPLIALVVCSLQSVVGSPFCWLLTSRTAQNSWHTELLTPELSDCAEALWSLEVNLSRHGYPLKLKPKRSRILKPR